MLIKSDPFFVKAAAFSAICLMAFTARAEDWPCWMGQGYQGIWNETGILRDMPQSGLKVLWRTPVQGGYSGPAVADGRLVVMDFASEPVEGDTGRLRSRSGSERILCLDATSGKEIWKHEYETTLAVSYPGGPRSTPTIDGKLVYIQGTMGQLLCLEIESGAVKWQKNVTEEYSTKPPIWGYASQPLIVDNLLICAAGGEGNGVVAFNKLTGEEVWSNITAREIGYAPFVPTKINGSDQLIVWYDVAIVGLELSTGRELWSHKFPEAKPQRPVVSIVPPKVLGNKIFISNYYHGSTLFQVEEDFTTKEVWSTEKDTKHDEDINSIMSTVVSRDGCLMGVAGNGELRCVNQEDGSLQWRSYMALATAEEDPAAIPRGDKGFPSLFAIEHQGKYWLFTDQGDLILSELSADGYKELGRSKLLETTAQTRGRAYVWCPPACSEGMLFVRNEKELICVDMRSGSYQ
ncbi:MAG: PQQ-binding-like beta-propeller repeat protein [Planctomycetota bacterium]